MFIQVLPCLLLEQTLQQACIPSIDDWVAFFNPSEAILATTPYIGYTYDVTQSGGNFTKRLRPLTMKYPSGKTLNYAYGTSGSTSFFNSRWQELESVTSGTTSVYVWGSRYIDDLILRDRAEVRLYSLADPNWNVVALTDAAGAVQERMRYDAFGKITWLTATFGPKVSSGFAWNRAFTGQVLDTETDLMLYRNRHYHTGLGRFITRDPIGYEEDSANFYRYIFNFPTNTTDKFGLGIYVDMKCVLSLSIPGRFETICYYDCICNQEPCLGRKRGTLSPRAAMDSLLTKMKEFPCKHNTPVLRPWQCPPTLEKEDANYTDALDKDCSRRECMEEAIKAEKTYLQAICRIPGSGAACKVAAALMRHALELTCGNCVNP